MARSSLTVEELRAAAMLLDMTYDANDHTFYRYHGVDTIELLDADTGWLLYMGHDSMAAKLIGMRRGMVTDGHIGAKNYDGRNIDQLMETFPDVKI